MDKISGYMVVGAFNTGGAVIGEVLLILAIALVIYLIFKIGKVLLKLVIGIIANSILGIIAIVLADYFLNLGINLSLKLIIPIAIFGLPGVGTIVLLKLLGVPV